MVNMVARYHSRVTSGVLFFFGAVHLHPRPKVGDEVRRHLRRIPAEEKAIVPDQGMRFQDCDGGDSSDSGLESIL